MNSNDEAATVNLSEKRSEYDCQDADGLHANGVDLDKELEQASGSGEQATESRDHPDGQRGGIALDDAEAAVQPMQQQPMKKGCSRAKRKYHASAPLAHYPNTTMSIEEGTCSVVLPFLSLALIRWLISYGPSCPM